MFKFSFLTAMHQNSTCGAAENVGTTAKPNGIMHVPVRSDRPNTFSNNNSSILSYIQKTVDIPSQTVGPSMFELPDHAFVGPGHEVRPKILSLPNQPSFLTLEIERVAVENVFNLKGIRYFGHCISYAVIASVLLGAIVSRHLSVTDPLAARRDALQSTVTLEKVSTKKTEIAPTWNNIEGINSNKSIDSGRPSLDLCSSSCHSVVQEPEVGSSYVDRNLEHNLVVCSSSGLESQGGDYSTSTSANQQILDLNLALEFQEKLSDPRITAF
ncbi:hypothetical protein T459_28962 [Capsicum annuum]|uniref:Uncharacterized protein n=1 Tax=Capsicum annuum TaxID=4072 RepID=A0A2G2YIC9_CAPAN|nr:hypothetical protein T459_28962 [Capsicum annuum]